MRGRVTHDTSSDRTARKDYWGVVLDSRTPAALARFYAALLEWEIAADEDDWVTLRPPDGVAYLAFHLNEHHVRPVWPSTPDQPQQQLHLDFEVDDLPVAVRHAVELGASLAEFQPQDDVRVLLDPDGHPFCLYT
jgi:catechol 2,3-dioxygenase-like lactoylglutathione lyase family enzyme